MATSHINESVILDEVMSTHDPDGKENFEINVIFDLVKSILYPITIGDSIDEDEDSDKEDSNKSDEEEDSNGDESDDDKMSNDEKEFDRERQYAKDMELPFQLKRFSFEMSLMCSKNVDPHSIVLYFLNMLSTFSWEGKILILLASFSLYFGKFSLFHSHKGLSGKLAILNERESQLLPIVKDLIKSILHLTEYIAELAKSSSHNSSPIIPIGCYWIVTSILTYASYFTSGLMHSGCFIAEETRLSSLTVKIKDVISECHPILEEKREVDSYNALCHAFFDENPIPFTSNLDVLKLLFNVQKGGKQKLIIYDGDEQEMVELRSLENKSLLLLISSNLDIEEYLIKIFKYFQNETKLRVLWIPILDYPILWDIRHMKVEYRRLVNKGELLSVRNVQKLVAPSFVRFVREKLFEIGGGGEPIIVSLDHQGRIVHHNAMHMILMIFIDIVQGINTGVEIGDSIIPLLQNVLKDRTLAIRSLVPEIDGKLKEIAGKMERLMLDELDEMEKRIQNPVYSNIYTSERETDLWKLEIWCTKLMMGEYEGVIKLVNENKYIFLIGGNDLKWVKAFVSKVMQVVSLNPQLAIMITYLGSNVKVGSTILQDNICEAPTTAVGSWFIWARLRSIFLSRIRFLNQTYCDEDHDEIVEGLKKMLAYEAKDSAVEGWAMLCKGNKIVVCDLGDTMLTVMNEYEKWKESAIAKGFDQAFKDHHEMLSRSIYASKHHPCCALDYPCNFDKVPEIVKCPQCYHNMQKFVTFRCHHDIVDDVDSDDEDFY
ncbi:PREDICTED: protein SIEVE ELEMENT OCCLUSION B-like [Ipomoea nil]|uniref:protein SIEVE ELEMENT OCCLUSION B-like n=1 Tax=Ipomoea nil TaxID=35883 RepID=UPI0009019902|nr:PREDICTED: protein SIEVE ELEMENT OCCLUSION B-like [Ipomoea nil]